MARPRKDKFDEQDYLGGRISTEHPLFKELAMLGYEEAEQLAGVKFLEWFLSDEGRDSDPIATLAKLIEFVGMATFLRNTRELTKLSMILGYSPKEFNYEGVQL